MANRTHLRVLRKSVTTWNRWRTESRTEIADLAGADLVGADLVGADLSGARLTLADLARARLTEADLTGADLARARLARARLAGANLSEADLTRTRLTEADLTGADLTRANLSEANLTGADLTRANLSEANLSEANLTEANLTGADLARATWNDRTVWPEGFEPPPREPDRTEEPSPEPDGSVSVADLYDPVRVGSLDVEQAANFGRSLEPLLGQVRNMVHDDVFSDEDTSAVEYLLGSIERELFHSPVDPDGAVLAAYSASLLRRIGPYLPEDVSNDPDSGWDTASVHRMFDDASRLGEGTPDNDGNRSASVAETAAEAVPDPAPEEPDPKVKRQRRIDNVIQIVGWAGGGAAGGSQALPAIITGLSPIWGAVVGAIFGLLKNVYKARKDGSGG